MMATSTTGHNSKRENSAKATVADQISQALQSTSNLLHRMQQTSPAQAQLKRLPKNLLAKTSAIKNTEQECTSSSGRWLRMQVLEQMPGLISSLDADMKSGLQSVAHLKNAIQLLANMESNNLNSPSQTRLP